MELRRRFMLILAVVTLVTIATAGRADVFRTVLDDCEADTWAFTHENPSYDGMMVNAYDTTTVHSPVRAIRQSLAGGGMVGQDGDCTFATRSFPVTAFAPDSLYAWFQVDARQGTSCAYAVLLRVRALDGDGAELGQHTWCLYVWDAWGGNDWDRIWGERTFTASDGLVPDTLGVWFRRLAWNITGELKGAALVEVSALDGSGAVLATGTWCVAVTDNIDGSWEQQAGWHYLEGRPAEYQAGAPDYERNADGSIMPPEGWWYRLAVPLREDLAVDDWRLVTAVRVRLGMYGAWLLGDTVNMLWDDVCLATTALPARPACDDMESRSPAWVASHDVGGYPGSWNVTYTTAEAHSDSTSLAIGLAGGDMGADHDVIRATRDFPLHGEDVPAAVGAWFCCTSRHSVLWETQQAALLAVSAVDGSGQVLGTTTWCVFVDDNVGNWESRTDWHYLESRPDEYEPGAPDYGRGADGSIKPPLGWWYRLVVPLDDLAVDWSQAATLRVQLIAQGAYLFDNDGFWLDWDDVCLEGRWLTGTPPARAGVPAVVLEANAPNPFNPRTLLRFRTAAPGEVTVAVYDVAGHLVTELWRGVLAAGEHAVPWDGRDRTGRVVSAGVYYGVVRCGGATAARPMLLLK